MDGERALERPVTIGARQLAGELLDEYRASGDGDLGRAGEGDLRVDGVAVVFTRRLDRQRLVDEPLPALVVVDIVGGGDLTEELDAVSLDLEDRRILSGMLFVLEEEH